MKQLIRDLAGVACIAGFGGFIRTLVGKARHEPYNLKTGVTEVLIAVFAGFLAHWLGQEYIASDNLRTAAIALAGYSARGLDAAVITRCKALARFFGRVNPPF